MQNRKRYELWKNIWLSIQQAQMTTTFIIVNHSVLKDGTLAKGINPLARPIDKGSYMVLKKSNSICVRFNYFYI